MEKIHIFLRTELKRLKISAAQAARDANEPDSQGLRDVLSGRKRLSAELLGALVANTQIDALYVLTGKRSAPIAQPLPADEQMWLDCYRGWELPVKRKELARALGLSSTEILETVPVITPSVQISGNQQHNTGDGVVQIGSMGHPPVKRRR